MDQFPVLSHKRVLGLAPEHIDSARLYVILLPGIPKQRPGIVFGNPAASFVFVEGTLKGTKQNVTLRFIGVDHPQPGVVVSVRGLEHLTNFRDVHHLAIQDKEVTLLDARILAKTPCFPNTSLELSLDLAEKRPVLFKVFTQGSVRNLIHSPLFSGRAYMAQLRQLSTRRHLSELCQKLVVSHVLPDRLLNTCATP